VFWVYKGRLLLFAIGVGVRNWSGGCKERFWWVWLKFGGRDLSGRWWGVVVTVDSHTIIFITTKMLLLIITFMV